MAQRNVTANNGAIRASLIIIATLFLLAVVYYASAIFAPLAFALLVLALVCPCSNGWRSGCRNPPLCSSRSW